jgi:MFS family permease
MAPIHAHERNGTVAASAAACPSVRCKKRVTVGRTAQSWGRRPLLMICFMPLCVRSAVFAVSSDTAVIVAAQLLDGISAATLGVLVPLVIADTTRNSGHFNLAQGVVGIAVDIGASLGTTMAGYVADMFGDAVVFLFLGSVGAAGLLKCPRRGTRLRPRSVLHQAPRMILRDRKRRRPHETGACRQHPRRPLTPLGLRAERIHKCRPLSAFRSCTIQRSSFPGCVVNSSIPAHQRPLSASLVLRNALELPQRLRQLQTRTKNSWLLCRGKEWVGRARGTSISTSSKLPSSDRDQWPWR